MNKKQQTVEHILIIKILNIMLREIKISDIQLGLCTILANVFINNSVNNHLAIRNYRIEAIRFTIQKLIRSTAMSLNLYNDCEAYYIPPHSALDAMSTDEWYENRIKILKHIIKQYEN